MFGTTGIFLNMEIGQDPGSVELGYDAAMLNLFDAQLISLFTLLAGTFTCGTLPILCFGGSKCFSSGTNGGSKIMSFLIFFGGGVLMSTCFLHLLPEAREAFEEEGHHEREPDISSKNGTTDVHAEQHSESFSVPEFIVLCGFFATYLIEEAIHKVVILTRKSKDSANGDIRMKFCSCAQRHTECSRTFKDVKPDQSLFGLEKKKQSGLLLSTGECFAGMSVCDDQHNVAAHELLQSSVITQPVPNYGTVTTITTSRVDPLVPEVGPPTVQMPERSPPLPHHHQHHLPETISISSLLTVAALSFHSVFEGFAIGFQQTAMDTWTLLLAVSLHKFVIAFVVGIEVLADGGRWLLVVSYIGVFSVMSPMGTALAMYARTSVDSMSQVVVGSVNCIACGTLLYVTFYEILRREREGSVTGFLRLFSIALGAGVMASLQYATTSF